jgi:hypothetical protein
MKNGENQQRVTVHVRVPEYLYRYLKVKSGRTGVPMDVLVLSAIDRDLRGMVDRRGPVWSGK